jgi:hypothetical protein
MLYEVALYEPNPYECCHEVTRRFTVGSLRAAELAAESLLKPHAHSETWYTLGQLGCLGLISAPMQRCHAARITP